MIPRRVVGRANVGSWSTTSLAALHQFTRIDCAADTQVCRMVDHRMIFLNSALRMKRLSSLCAVSEYGGDVGRSEVLTRGPTGTTCPPEFLRRFFMSDDLQPWIDLSTSDEKEWMQSRYDGEALPPGIASRLLKAVVKRTNRGRPRAIPAESRRGPRKDRRPTASNDWQRLVGWMREFSSDPFE
jgi:hypothetical protein